MDLGLFFDPDVPFLPIEMLIHIISVSCLTQLLELSEVNLMLHKLVDFEIRKRLNRLKVITVQKGSSPKNEPICFFLTEFSSETCQAKVKDNEIMICGKSLILKFLRLFGNEIEFIIFNCSYASEVDVNTVFKQVVNFCPNLNYLTFGNLRHSLANSLLRPLEKVQLIFFQYCVLWDKLCELDVYFPNVRTITFSEMNVYEDGDKLIRHYARLEKFEACEASLNLLDVFFLQLLNPQAIISSHPIYNEVTRDLIVNDF